MIPFTEYVLPNGRQRAMQVTRPAEVEAQAAQIIAAGYRFEAEILRTGHVTLTVHDVKEGVDIAIKLVDNGPQVPVAVDLLVREALEIIAQKS